MSLMTLSGRRRAMIKMIPLVFATIVGGALTMSTPAMAAKCGVGGQWVDCAKVKKGTQVSYVPGCNGSYPGKKVKYGPRTFTCAGDR